MSKEQLHLFPVTEIESGGVTMGILSDGTPYLSARGLARLCDVSHSVILDLANNWQEEKEKPRGQKIAEYLVGQFYDSDHLYVRIPLSEKNDAYAFPDAVCMAVLEYYALEAKREKAFTNYRMLARLSLRQFIFNKTGYDPLRRIGDSWNNFRERIELNAEIPIGYFSIFREMADFIVVLIRAGLLIDHHTVPDISVGQIWSAYWTANNFNNSFGERRKHYHRYPANYPQSAVEPDSWIYPVHSLGEFRIWLSNTYLPEKFPGYLKRKVQQGKILPEQLSKALDTLSSRKEIAPKTYIEQQTKKLKENN